MTVLIVGGDSMIGKRLATELAGRHYRVLQSTRRSDGMDRQRPFIDLASDLTAWTPPAETRIAVLCAARSNQQDCTDNPEATRAVNVTGTIAVGAALAKAGIFTILLSTNLVFDGSRPGMPSDSPYSAVNPYGEQKAELEGRLRALFAPEHLAILRMTKVLAKEMPLLCKWRSSLEAGQIIAPFDDVAIAPISLPYVTDALVRIIAAFQGGIVQISGATEINYAEIARRLARQWGHNEKLVVPQHGRDINEVARDAPPHGSLDPSFAVTRLNLFPQATESVIEDLA